MRLRKFITLNYKSAKSVEVGLSKNKIKTLIGVNDCGKSTILRSLKLFFDEKPSVLFESDSTKRSVLSNTPLNTIEFDNLFNEESLPNFDKYSENMIGILCIFEIDKSYSLDELDEMGISPHMQHVINKLSIGDSVPILRTFSADGEKASYFIVTQDAIDSEGLGSELWNQTQANIKKKQADEKIEDSAIVNRNSAGPLKNIERVFAIYEKIGTSSKWSPYLSFKKDAVLFPSFRYLDWNITTEELNQITADIIKPIIDSKIKIIQQQINTQRDSINEEANAALKTIYDKYSDALPSSITGINANINLGLQQSVTELFIEKSTSDKKVYLDDQGDGIRRQIGLGLIKALAQENLTESDISIKYLWCFDEPETHLFPQAQRDLAISLSLLANAQFQVIISTHSTLFVDRSNLSDISLLSLEDGYTTYKTTNTTDDIFSSLGVRNSDFLFFNRFIAVEGPTEYGVFNHMYNLLYGHNLSDDGIQLINLSGKDNKPNQERLMSDIFKDFQKQKDITIYALDKDTARNEDNILLIGDVADFEDSLENEIWLDILMNYCHVTITIEEINEIRSKISLDTHGKKLHSMLAKYVSDKKQVDDNVEYLPSKGDQLADLLVIRLSNPKQVPESIKLVFEKAKTGL